MKPGIWLMAGVSMAMMLSACGEKDYYDPDKVEEIKQQTYAERFVAKYGTVPSNFSWDASSGNSHWEETTRAEDGTWYACSESYDEVEKPILDWLNTNLGEAKNHKNLGEPFVMTVPDNEFTIMPIYQGSAATYSFDFYVVIDGMEKPIKLMSKSEHIQVLANVYERETTSDKWTQTKNQEWLNLKDLDTDKSNGMNANTIQGNKYYNATGGRVAAEKDAVKKVVTSKVQAQKFTFNRMNDYVGKLMTFYVEITSDNNNTIAKGTTLSSTEGYMLALKGCPTPTNLEEGTECIVIGCETMKDPKHTDWDMNELVFLVYGKPYPPVVIEIKNDQIDEVIEKRYMFEDLGSTDDFDFNDVVVDFRDIVTKQITTENGVITDKKDIDHRQEAVVRHLGGTLPFDLKVAGKTVYSDVGQMNANPDKTIPLNDCPWIPSANNVSLTVSQKTSSDLFTEYTVAFPQIGCEAPMVIATNVSVDWMAERTSITMDWFNSLKGN